MMRTWRACTTVEGEPERVLAVLTDPEACARWSPVRFDVEDLDGDRLRTGSALRLAGRLAGRTVGFEVRILRADERRLALRARGPVDIEADYEVEPVAERTRLRASVSVQAGPGLTGRVLRSATDALLAGGALDHAVARIAREAESLALAA
jgi:carbon monoxide dehydrogenase subunit G